jgi:hypothetical protein
MRTQFYMRRLEARRTKYIPREKLTSSALVKTREARLRSQPYHPLALTEQRQLEAVARPGVGAVGLRLEEMMACHAIVAGDDLPVLLSGVDRRRRSCLR